MEPSGIERFGAKRFGQYLAGQGPLSSVDVLRTRLLIGGFPLLALVAVVGFGVSSGRAVSAVVMFALWTAVQMLVLSPARRRQVLGLPAADEAGATRG